MYVGIGAYWIFRRAEKKRLNKATGADDEWHDDGKHTRDMFPAYIAEIPPETQTTGDAKGYPMMSATHSHTHPTPVTTPLAHHLMVIEITATDPVLLGLFAAQGQHAPDYEIKIK